MCVGLMVTSCGTSSKESGIISPAIENSQLIQDSMLVYIKGDSELPESLSGYLPEDIELAFYWIGQDLNILFYVADANQPAVVWINGKGYSFSYGYGYSPMESEAPFISICDINKDTERDILISGTAYRTELRQDAYLSDGAGGYAELGDVTWNKGEVTHPFSFHASYGNDYKVRIAAPDWKIDETKELDKMLKEELTTLGIYDENGNVTEYGQDWEITQLQGKSVGYTQDNEGNVYLYYETQIEAGYSEATLGYGFQFQYLIADKGYILQNVVFIKRTGIKNAEIESVTVGGQKVEIKKEILEIDGDVDRRHIEYPYLDSDNNIAQLINEQIYDLIDRECLQDSEYAIYEEITYEAMGSDDQILSIHFTGYRSVAASYADFDMALNFDMDTGEILTLQSFYTLAEIRQLVDAAMTDKKLSVVNIPLKEDEMQDYINQYFKKIFSNDSYIRRSDNFFVNNGNLYFIAESYPSLRQYTYVEWKDAQQFRNKF